ncbi:MAG: lipid-binding SYLF domain-containing protein [Acidobacteriia bacterium]|nr:lipid-binding SYLF domain-containing protein [Terriglobia bacterium]MBV8904422.1 lipid-binding SYLF domain-containing protein [Terriglobia bacterium]
MRHIKLSRTRNYILLVTALAALPAFAVTEKETAARLGRAATVLSNIEKGHGLKPDQLANADCVVVIPGFKKGAAVIGIGLGRGFISCRTAGGWSAPGAVSLETTSLGVQVGGEKMDIVIVSKDPEKRPKLLSDRFAVGDEASVAWGNGKTAQQDPDARILFFGHAAGAFAGFGLNGSTLKVDVESNKALYGKPISNGEIIAGEVTAPSFAQPFLAALSH